MAPEERAGEADVLFSDWTVSERQELFWAASGQDRTAGVRLSGQCSPGSSFVCKPLCATGVPRKRVAQGVSGGLGMLGLGIPTSSLSLEDSVLLGFP